MKRTIDVAGGWQE